MSKRSMRYAPRLRRFSPDHAIVLAVTTVAVDLAALTLDVLRVADFSVGTACLGTLLAAAAATAVAYLGVRSQDLHAAMVRGIFGSMVAAALTGASVATWLQTRCRDRDVTLEGVHLNDLGRGAAFAGGALALPAGILVSIAVACMLGKLREARVYKTHDRTERVAVPLIAISGLVGAGSLLIVRGMQAAFVAASVGCAFFVLATMALRDEERVRWLRRVFDRQEACFFVVPEDSDVEYPLLPLTHGPTDSLLCRVGDDAVSGPYRAPAGMDVIALVHHDPSRTLDPVLRRLGAARAVLGIMLFLAAAATPLQFT